MCNRFVISGLLMLTMLSGYSQQTDFFQIMESAKNNYPLIRARQAEISAADRDVKASASEYLPRISVQHQFTYGTSNSVTGSFYPNGGTVISPSGGVHPGNIYTATYGSFTSALLEWNIFNFGKVAASVNVARSARDGQEAEYANELFQHQIRVADGYLLLITGEKLEKIQRANLERALRFREAVDAGVRSGMRPGVDSAMAHAEFAKAKLLLLESESNTRANAYRLNEFIGDDQSRGLAVDTMLFYSQLPITADTLTSYSASHPLLSVFAARQRLSEARSISLRRAMFPSITFVASGWARGSGVSNEDDTYHTDFSSGTDYQVYNYMFGIATRWTLTDLLPTHYRYRSEHYRNIRDRELYQTQVLSVNRQVREANMLYRVALEQAAAAPVQLLAAQQAYLQADARYKSGLSDLPTLLQSMVTLNRAEADMAVAYSNVWRSLLKVAASRGDLTVFTTAIPR